jgi:hypothetical protein
VDTVEVKDILIELDNEIARLQQARSLLAGEVNKKSSVSAKKTLVVKSGTKGRKLTPEGRKRIAEAMKKRWAEWKKQSA